MVRTVGLSSYSDIHFTSGELAQAIVRHFNPTGRCLEPFRGAGAFLDHLPAGTDWCELAEGRDFFQYEQKVDWIITNPPFSNMTRVFEHAFRISEHCVFLIPIAKYFSSAPRLDLVRAYGGLAEILHVGSGRSVGFDIGFPFGALHFARGYRGSIKETILPKLHAVKARQVADTRQQHLFA